MNKIEQKKQWHSGFYGAIELEFKDNKDDLIFDREHQLSKKPLSADMLIIKKADNAIIKNEIGGIFRKHNIIEYKSPKAALGIDQFYKGIADTCLYKSQGEYADEIKSSEITLTFMRERKPRKLLKTLAESGHTITKTSPGIYSVTNNIMFPIQIIVTIELDSDSHLTLKVLSDNVNEDDAKRFVSTSSTYTNQGDKNNADALLYISIEANKKVYYQIREEDKMRNEALRELMSDVIEEEKNKAATDAEKKTRNEYEQKLKALKFENEEKESENKRLKEEIKRLKLAML